MKTLGIITTTFNRAYCIHQVYESLIKQECKDFIWLVIDDGSTDNTKEIIQGYINEDIIEIQYFYHENMGMTASRNIGYENVKTEINTIIDSDDWLEEGAVEKIINFWNANKKDNIAGIIALNRRIDGDISGSTLPEDIHQCTFTDLRDKYKSKGDKKLIYRSDISRLYPYPRFKGEKYYPADYKFRLIDLEYEMLLMNEVVCVVDFNENGATFGRMKQYQTCARSFSHYRNTMMRISTNPTYIFRQAIHYISSSKFEKNKHYIQNASKKLYVILSLPLGFLLYFYIKNTKRKSLKHTIKE